MKKIVVVSDLQVPFHHKAAVHALCQFVADWQPDALLNVGDDIDSPEPSRWNKGMAGEYVGTLQKGIDATYEVHEGFRLALGWGKPYHVMRSNHGDRVQTYVRKYAPALDSLRSLQLETLLGYDDLDITFHRMPFEFSPGWVLAHGDEAGLSQSPGGTAMSLARRLGKSVLCGHTHRAGIQHETRGLNGRTQTIFGIETGHLMDIKKAGYLKTGSANWRLAFATLELDGKYVQPNLVTMANDGSFLYGGRKYGGR